MDRYKQLQIEDFLRTIAACIDGSIKDTFGHMGFALIMFDFNAPGVGNYISNAKREDMIKSLRETADRIEKRQDIPAAHTTVH